MLSMPFCQNRAMPEPTPTHQYRIDLGLQASLPAADLAALDLPVAWLRPMRPARDYFGNRLAQVRFK